MYDRIKQSPKKTPQKTKNIEYYRAKARESDIEEKLFMQVSAVIKHESNNVVLNLPLISYPYIHTLLLDWRLCRPVFGEYYCFASECIALEYFSLAMDQPPPFLRFL